MCSESAGADGVRAPFIFHSQLAKTKYAVPEEIRNQQRIRKRNDETQSAGCVKDVPEALRKPGRNQVPSLR